MDSQVGIGYMSSYIPGGAFVASLFIGLAIYEAMQDSTRAKRKALNKARNHIDTIEKFKEFINAQGQCCDIPSWVSFQEVASPLPDHCLFSRGFVSRHCRRVQSRVLIHPSLSHRLAEPKGGLSEQDLHEPLADDQRLAVENAQRERRSYD